MEKVVYSTEMIKIMSMFQSLTKAVLKDCIEGKSQIMFVVQPGEAGKAIGRNAENVKKLAARLKRKIKIVEFSDNTVTFIKNLMHPIKPANIENIEGTIMITPLDLKSRGYIIGKEGINLRTMEQIVKRYFNVKEIKVARV